MGRDYCLKCQKPDRQGGLPWMRALPDGRASDTLANMTRRRFYAPPIAFSPDGQSATLGADETRHLRDVLRLRVGDEAYVFDGEGREFRGSVSNTDRNSSVLRVIE